MIVAYMPFFNELDLLEIKFHTMAGVVDKFLICEATHTYTGLEKPMLFRDNRERFKNFNIHYLEVESLQGPMSPWKREDHQRWRMFEETQRIGARVLISGDVDEIVRPEAVREFLKSKHRSMRMEQDWLQYYFNRERETKWALRTISRDGHHHTGTDLAFPLLPNAGWHFNLISGRRQGVADKLAATSHAADPGAPAFRKRVIDGEWPDLDKTRPYDESRLPKYVKDNRAKYKDYFL